MPLHIDEIQTQVEDDRGGAAPTTPAAESWQRRAELRELQAQLADDLARTAAHGNED
jgi:hypothetical protein